MTELKPEPVATAEICSLCGERWEGHIPQTAKGRPRKNYEPSVADCIRVLRLALATSRSSVGCSSSTFMYPSPLQLLTTTS